MTNQLRKKAEGVTEEAQLVLEASDETDPTKVEDKVSNEDVTSPTEVVGVDETVEEEQEEIDKMI